MASVAGKLLENCDNSLHCDAGIAKDQHYASGDIKEVDEARLSNENPLELGSSSEKPMLKFEINPSLQDLSLSGKNAFYGDDDEKSAILDPKNSFDDSTYISDIIEGKVQGLPERKLDTESIKTRSRIVKDEIIRGDLMKLEGKPSKLVGSRNDDIQEPFLKDGKDHRPFTYRSAKDQVGSTDDNESSLGSPIHTANKRIKKISETKDWRGDADVTDCAYRRVGNRIYLMHFQ